MTPLSINLNQPLSNWTNSNANFQFKSFSSSNLYLGHSRRISSVVPPANSKSKLESLSSNFQFDEKFKSRLRLNKSDFVVPVTVDFDSNANSKYKSTPKFLSSTTYSINYSQPVVLPMDDAQSKVKVVAFASFDPQPVVPVVLPIAGFDAFPARAFPMIFSVWPHNHFFLHNKLMLKPQQLSPKNNIHSLLYRHSFCFVGHGSYLLAGCCNNLMLVCFYDRDRSTPREALWNQTTNDLKFLPQLDVPRCVLYHSRVIHTSITSYGFGFDPVSMDYKVLRFIRFDYEDGNISFGSEYMELYSLKTDSWKRLTANSNPGKVIPFAVPSVHINGIYYWKAESEEDIEEEIEEDSYLGRISLILSFDFASEKFFHIPEPKPMHNIRKALFVGYDLVEFDRSLAALVHSELGSSSKPFTFEIWVWRSASGTWVQRVPQIDVPATDIATVVGLFENDKLFLQTTNKELLLFDCATRELENLGIHADPTRLWFKTKQ